MSDGSKRSRGELDKEIGDAVKEGIVAAAVMLHGLQQGRRDQGREDRATYPVGGLLFDLAKLNTRILGDLARFSTEQADLMVDYLEKRRRRAHHGTDPHQPPLLALVRATMPANGDSATDGFRLRNDATFARSYAIPEVIELTPLHGSDDPVYVVVESTPPRVDVPPNGQASVTLKLKRAPQIVPGASYRGRVPLVAAGDHCPSVDLVVELNVADAATAAPAKKQA